jgi:hypothetical protein
MPDPVCARTEVERRHAAAKIDSSRRQFARRLSILGDVVIWFVWLISEKYMIACVHRRYIFCGMKPADVWLNRVL